MIYFSFSTPAGVLSSEIPDITILTDHEAIDVRMSVNGEALLEGKYYATDGSIIISDTTSLIEQYIIANIEEQLVEVSVEGSFGEEEIIEKSFNVLYCDKALGLTDTEGWLKENFLTLTRSRRLAPDSFINVSWYTTAIESITFMVYVTYLDEAERRSTYHYMHSGNGLIAHMDGVMTQTFYLSEIRQKIMEVRNLKSVSLQSVTVRCGNRSVTYFIDPALANVIPIYYLNCFGVPEHISMPRTTTRKVKTDRSVALLGKTSEFYDVTHSKEYEVESGPLTADECLQTEQMLTSPKVKIPADAETALYESDFYALAEILITDFTCEFSDTDEQLNKVKFTWRYADNRQLMAGPHTPGIFNDSFNPTFT